MPQAFHQRVNHDNSGYPAANDRWLFLAAMVWSDNCDHARDVGGRQRAIRVGYCQPSLILLAL